MSGNVDDLNFERPIVRPLVWMGDSKRRIQAFPDEAQKLMGDQLQLIQFGGMPKNAKPFKGVGGGVFEIALRHDSEAYRAVLAIQLGPKIYVLHAFQKKSHRGIATPRKDVELIKHRLSEAKTGTRDEQ